MKTASAELLALFASDQPFEQFDLYTFTLYSGLVLRYANCPFDVVYDGVTWLCARNGGVVIDEEGDSSGPRAHWSSGFEVGSWQVTVMQREEDRIGVLPWGPAVRAGILQEATVRVDRGYVLAWPDIPTLTLTPAGIVNVFFGRTAEIDFGRSSVQININDPRELLDIDMPRNLYTAQCRYALFSPQCGLIKEDFAEDVTVGAVTSTQLFAFVGPAFAANYFALGNMVFTSGDNEGLRMMIRSSTAAGELSLIAPMPFTVAPGDTLTIYPGCDKAVSTCEDTFDNRLNHGGFTEIPAAETAI